MLFVIFLFNTQVFSREKITENTNGVAYSYSDWNEFYEFLISTLKKTSYRFAYLLSGNDLNLFEDSDFQANNDWQLFSLKGLSERNMIESFIVLSPNNHQACLVLSSDFSFGDLKYHIATKQENDLQSFLYEIESAFDERLCFFDEDVPLKLLDFSKVSRTPHASASSTTSSVSGSSSKSTRIER